MRKIFAEHLLEISQRNHGELSPQRAGGQHAGLGKAHHGDIHQRPRLGQPGVKKAPQREGVVAVGLRGERGFAYLTRVQKMQAGTGIEIHWRDAGRIGAGLQSMHDHGGIGPHHLLGVILQRLAILGERIQVGKTLVPDFQGRTPLAGVAFAGGAM